MTIGKFLENVEENQVVVIYDKNHNINWIGKAGYAPIYTDHMEYKNSYVCGNELRINEIR